jgi:hypothetical protein
MEATPALRSAASASLSMTELAIGKVMVGQKHRVCPERSIAIATIYPQVGNRSAECSAVIARLDRANQQHRRALLFHREALEYRVARSIAGR